MKESHQEITNPDLDITIIGAGMAGLACALALSRANPKPRKIRFIDRGKEDDDGIPIMCKGCAGGVLAGNIRHLQQEYDDEIKPITHIDEATGAIRVSTVAGQKAEEGRILSPGQVDRLTIHMPDADPADDTTVQLPIHIDVVSRGRGPRLAKGFSQFQLGLNRYLWELLLRRMNIERIVDTVDQINTSEKQPVTIHTKGGQEFTSDLVILASGASRATSAISIDGKPVTMETPTLNAHLVEMGIPDGEETDKLYGVNRNVAHVVLAAEGDIEYGFFLPQTILVPTDDQGTIINRTLVTFAAFARQGHTINHDSVAEFLARTNVDFFPAADLSETQQLGRLCACNALIPRGPVPLEILQYLARNGILVIGDAAGILKLMKNGIGTGIELGEEAGRLLVDKGVSPVSLQEIITELYQLNVPDGINYGRPLLDMVTSMYQNPILRYVLNKTLKQERYLPGFMQNISDAIARRILDAIAKVATGADTYQDVVEGLTSGKEGLLIKIACALLGFPLP